MSCRKFTIAVAAIVLGLSFGRSALAQPQRRGLTAPTQPEIAISIHIRVAELWKTEPLKEMRTLIERAGPKALETYLRRFAMTPADVDELTIFAFAGPADRPNQLREPILVIKTRTAVKEDHLAAFVLPGARGEKVGAVTLYSDADSGLALFFAGPKEIVAGRPDAIRAALADIGMANLATALAAMTTDKLVTVVVNRFALPQHELDHAPPPFGTLLQARRASLTLDLRTEIALKLSLHFADSDAAAEGEKAAREALNMARRQLQALKAEVGKPVFDPTPMATSDWPQALGSLFGLAAIGQGDEILAGLPIQRDGTAVSTQVSLPMQPAPPVALSAALAAAGVAAYWTQSDSPREARPPAMRGVEARTSNNLKMIGLALHNYASAYNHFPGQAITSKDGKPLLSWRVAILPYLDQDNLYKQFKLDEPWDSEHNQKLIERMPAVYSSPNAPPTREPGLTHFQVFVGGGAAWSPGPRGPRISQFTDGMSNTILVAQAKTAVPWTKPEDMPYDPKKAVPEFLADATTGGVLFLMGDASVLRKPANLPEQMIRAAITRAGGEVVDWSGDEPDAPAPVPRKPTPIPPKTRTSPVPRDGP